MPKILIAEYNELVSEIHQRNFSKEGFDATIAHNEKEVSDITQKEKIDMLLINERIGGYDFVREIRKNNPEMKIFIIGVGHSHPDPRDREKAVESGADDFINNIKVMPNKLLDIVMGRIKNDD